MKERGWNYSPPTLFWLLMWFSWGQLGLNHSPENPNLGDYGTAVRIQWSTHLNIGIHASLCMPTFWVHIAYLCSFANRAPFLRPTATCTPGKFPSIGECVSSQLHIRTPLIHPFRLLFGGRDLNMSHSLEKEILMAAPTPWKFEPVVTPLTPPPKKHAIDECSAKLTDQHIPDNYVQHTRPPVSSHEGAQMNSPNLKFFEAKTTWILHPPKVIEQSGSISTWGGLQLGSRPGGEVFLLAGSSWPFARRPLLSAFNVWPEPLFRARDLWPL